jgi:hypothetical protein
MNKNILNLIFELSLTRYTGLDRILIKKFRSNINILDQLGFNYSPLVCVYTCMYNYYVLFYK